MDRCAGGPGAGLHPALLRTDLFPGPYVSSGPEHLPSVIGSSAPVTVYPVVPHVSETLRLAKLWGKQVLG